MQVSFNLIMTGLGVIIKIERNKIYFLVLAIIVQTYMVLINLWFALGVWATLKRERGSFPFCFVGRAGPRELE